MLCQALLEKEKVHRDEFEALFTMEKSGESNEVYNMHKKQ